MPCDDTSSYRCDDTSSYRWDDSDACVTCSDEGWPATVLALPTGALGLATVRTAKGEEDVDISLVGEVRIDDVVLVHAGTAIALLTTRASIGEQT